MNIIVDPYAPQIDLSQAGDSAVPFSASLLADVTAAIEASNHAQLSLLSDATRVFKEEIAKVEVKFKAFQKDKENMITIIKTLITFMISGNEMSDAEQNVVQKTMFDFLEIYNGRD